MLTSLASLQSGAPIKVSVNADTLDIGIRRNILPDRLCSGELPESQRTVDRWFDASCFAVDRIQHPVRDGRRFR